MKRIFSVLGIMMLVGLLACAAPKKKVTSKKLVKTAVNKTTKKKVANSKKQAAPKVLLKEFRLEYQNGEGRKCANSAVMSLNCSEYGDYLYNRGYGQFEGWSYDFDSGACKDLMIELSRIAEKKDLYSYKFTNLDDEDLAKPRWLVTMKTAEGKEYSMVEYSDGSDLLKLVEAAFKPMLERVEKCEIMAPYSHYHYNGDGSLNYRTDHTAEGIVHGGYNPKQPDATF